jgi:hypothetical protein
MKNYYFTFGDDRLDKYVKITALDERKARARMIEECGKRWCTSFDEESFMDILTRYPKMKMLFYFVEEEDA